MSEESKAESLGVDQEGSTASSRATARAHLLADSLEMIRGKIADRKNGGGPVDTIEVDYLARLLAEYDLLASANHALILARNYWMETAKEGEGKRMSNSVGPPEPIELTVREAEALLDNYNQKFFPHNADHLFSGVEKLRRIIAEEEEARFVRATARRMLRAVRSQRP